jgi:hypothetical protein
VSYGHAEIVRTPFVSGVTYRCARWEVSETVGTYTTDRGRARVLARTERELRESRGSRVVADTYTRRPSRVLFYRDPYGSLRFAEIRTTD